MYRHVRAVLVFMWSCAHVHRPDPETFGAKFAAATALIENANKVIEAAPDRIKALKRALKQSKAAVAVSLANAESSSATASGPATAAGASGSASDDDDDHVLQIRQRKRQRTT